MTARLADQMFEPSTRRRGDVYQRCQSIKCDECGQEQVVWLQGEPLPFKGMAAHFARRGWRVNKTGKHVCQFCQEAKRGQKEPDEMTAPLKPSAVSNDAREARRIAHMMIDEKYDASVQGYRDGYSDERIAKESGVSVEWVARRRDEEFGPIRVDPFALAIEQHLLALEGNMRTAMQAFTEAQSCVNQMRDELKRRKTGKV